ncbi:MAG: hypothetical protein FJ405_12545 [Verrucomicrobia bacterium]|nr:hypothetical protein [Verrucomicrobiota bacterium]
MRYARSERGAVLLEVVLALALFIAAVAMLSSALTASMQGVDRRRAQMHADNLAISTLSEIQMGIRSVAATGPEPMKPPLDAWVVRVVMAGDETDLTGGGLPRVEVVVRHKVEPVVRRLTGWMSPGLEAKPGPEPDRATVGGGLP